MHVGVYGERDVGNVGMGEGSDERLEDENVRFWNEGGCEEER